MHVGSSSSCQLYSVVSECALLSFWPFIHSRCLANPVLSESCNISPIHLAQLHIIFTPKNKKHQKIQYNFLPYTHTCVKLTLKLLPPAGSQNNDQQHTPNSPVPTQWYNGQETNDEIRYFRTPINNDFKLQEITNEIIRLKVVQFHTSQRIEYLDWCNKNEICPNDFTITIMTPEFNDLGFKHQKHCMEVMETSIKRYTEIHIANNQEQHNYANFQIQQKKHPLTADHPSSYN